MNFYLIIGSECYTLYPKRKYSLGIDKNNDIFIDSKETLEIDVQEEKISILEKDYVLGVHSLLIDQINIKLLILPEENYYLLKDDTITIGTKEADIIKINKEGLDLVLCLKNMKITSNKGFYHNGHRGRNNSNIRDYDQIIFQEGLSFRIFEDILAISGIFKIESELISLPTKHEKEDRSSEFHRSPRIILREPDSRIRIEAPPTDDEESRQSLWKIIITPLAMIGFTVLIYFLAARGAFIFLMMGMSVITIITSVHTYFTDKKKFKESQEKKLENYDKYLDSKSMELYSAKKDQEKSLRYHYPKVDNILKMTKNINRRIYEKTAHNFDFLTYRLGLGKVEPSFTIDYSETDLTEYNEAATAKANSIVSAYDFIENMPIKNDVNVPTGYIGNRKTVIEQVQQLMIQLATFHSYHDINFISIFREDELKLWNWSRHLPHMQIRSLNSRGFVYTQKSRDQILTSLYQIIKDRKLDASTEGAKERIYSPQYILLITDLSLLLDHSIMEYINEDLSSIGITYVFVEEVMESLPEHVKTVVEYRGNKKGKLILHDDEFLDKGFTPLPPISLEEKETFSRNIASINHVEILRNSIPDKVTFLEMYGVNKVSELEMLSKWNRNEAYKSMAVPLGSRGRDDMLFLDLHEKAHGPHGLIAGTTGSGKSELIQSYILSLAVNFHPQEVAFLLIDYKGGGMANLFIDLPHLVGTITNLDANQANRALVSINAELKKRQKIFAENDVNHINQYTKLFKEGDVSEPMPHLFIISDEFAELKAEQPDFMEELVSTARIGRSLGIHLILATQKPSGVVNDQIWSNSKFKIALKVQDVADSKEIIKTSDAAEITQTGRAYLQVGNNEVYELFQSSWSGAEYNPETKSGVKKDMTVYEIRDNGQYSPINKDLSGLDKLGTVKTMPTELEAIVEEAKETFTRTGLDKVASPWLAPLEENIYASSIESTNFKDYWKEEDEEINVLMGYMDRPHKQEQLPLYFDMEKAGHILLVSSPGFGKSTFLQSFAINIMRKKAPDKAHFYLYDFGSSGIISLSDFPHTADYFTMDEDEKILKSLRIIRSDIENRKKKLSQSKAMNLSQYNQLSKDSFVNKFILIDGFDALNDLSYSEEFNDVLNIIGRDGTSIGIYLVVTMSRMNSMRLQLQTNFKTKISLFLFDKSDLYAIVGRSNIHIEEVRGRALINLDEITTFQISLPYETENYGQYMEKIKDETAKMENYFKGEKPEEVPMLPEKVDEALLAKYIEKIDIRDKFVLGLSSETVTPATFDLRKSYMLASDNPIAVNNYYDLLDYNKKINDFHVVLLDPEGKVPSNKSKETDHFMDSVDLENATKTIIDELKDRMANPEKNHTNHLIVIPDIVSFISNSKISQNDYKLLVLEGGDYGVTAAFIGSYQDLVSSFDINVKNTRAFVEQVFIGMRISDQDHTRYSFISNEPYVKPFEGHILNPSGYEKVQIVREEK